MKKTIFGALLAAATVAAPAHATTYTYVGSWSVASGPNWTTNPAVYSGVGAAALLFGGSPANYVTSTVDSNPANINFKTWLDGWGDPFTYAQSGSPASDTYSLDTGGTGYNSNPGYQSSYSAYVEDHFNPAFYTGPAFINYAFLVSGAVPEPATWAMMLVGMGAIGFAMRRRATVSVAYA